MRYTSPSYIVRVTFSSKLYRECHTLDAARAARFAAEQASAGTVTARVVGALPRPCLLLPLSSTN